MSPLFILEELLNSILLQLRALLHHISRDHRAVPGISQLPIPRRHAHKSKERNRVQCVCWFALLILVVHLPDPSAFQLSSADALHETL